MPIRQRFDRLLLGATILLTAVGLALLASASWLLATERYGRPGSYFFTWQAATALIGLAVLVLCMHLRPEIMTDEKLTAVGLKISWVLLALAFLQAPVANTHRWLSIGGVSVQPSVVARVALILFAAVQLEHAQREGWPWRRLIVLAGVVTATVCLVIAEPDLGSAAVILLIVAAMAFVAGLPMRLLTLPTVIGVVGLIAAIFSSAYRLERVRAFFDPATASAAAWQTHQSLIALGSGGLFGRGYGAGLQKLFFLPEPHTDFIFSITGEELGLIGLLALMALAALIAWRGLRIAIRQVHLQRALIAFGITIAFTVQSVVHMAVCLALLPPKGIPLPLVSYGKTELLATLASLGLLLNLSREVSP